MDSVELKKAKAKKDHDASDDGKKGKTKDSEAGETGSQKEIDSCRNVKTVSLYLLFLTVGFSTPLLGSTIVHLGAIFSSSTRMMAFVFPACSVGFVIGSVLCGVVFDRVNKELSFSVSIIVATVSMCAAAFSHHVIGFMVCMLVGGIPTGFLITAGQSYCVNLWQNHRFKEPVLQGGHAIWSLGAAIGPFIIRPFLSELHYDGQADAGANNVSTLNNEWNATHSLDGNLLQHSPDGHLVNHQSPDGDHVNITNISDVAIVRFAYVTIGLIILIFGIPFFAIFLANCFSNRKKLSDESERSDKDGGDTTTKRSPSGSCNPVRIIFLVMLSYFTFLLVYIEGIPIAYYVTFCIKYLNWPVGQASLVMTIFFGAHFSGRMLGVPLSAYLAPRTMLIMNLLLSTTANVLLMFVNFFPAIMWISAAMAGFGISSTFPTIILWVSELIPVTGFVSSVLTVGVSMGLLTAPLLVGLLFDAYSPMFMVYVLLIVSICLFLFFLLQLAFVFKFKHRLRPSSDVKDVTT